MSYSCIQAYWMTDPLCDAGRWEWLSDSTSLLPPCDDAVSYYSHFGRTPGFTSAAGKRFRGVLDEHLHLFRWPAGTKARVAHEEARLDICIKLNNFSLLLTADFAPCRRTGSCPSKARMDNCTTGSSPLSSSCSKTWRRKGGSLPLSSVRLEATCLVC